MIFPRKRKNSSPWAGVKVIVIQLGSFYKAFKSKAVCSDVRDGSVDFQVSAAKRGMIPHSVVTFMSAVDAIKSVLFVHDGFAEITVGTDVATTQISVRKQMLAQKLFGLSLALDHGFFCGGERCA